METWIISWYRTNMQFKDRHLNEVTTARIETESKGINFDTVHAVVKNLHKQKCEQFYYTIRRKDD